MSLEQKWTIPLFKAATELQIFFSSGCGGGVIWWQSYVVALQLFMD